MRDSWSAAKVGMLVIAALAASYAGYRLVNEQARGSGKGYQIHAIFNDASGLVPKSRVLIAGIQVGYIDSIKLVGDRARVDVHVDDGVPLYQDSLIAKHSMSILGEAVLAITPGNIQTGRLPAGGEIQIQRETPSTDAILTNVARISESVLRITEQIERTFGTDQGGEQMKLALSSLTEALQGINRTIQTNEVVVNHALNTVDGITSNAAPQITSILDNVDKLTNDLRMVLDENRPGAARTVTNLDETVQSVQRAANELETVMGDVHQITDRTARGEGTVGHLTSDNTVMNEVDNVAEGVGDFVGGIDRLQTIVGLRSEYNFLANSFKSYVSLRLQPREDQYYFIELVDDPRGATTYQTQQVTTTPPVAGQPEVQQIRTVTTRDAFRFSLGLAKRIGFVTLRFGFIESTGGVGFDLHFFRDHLEIKHDIFALGAEAFPRFRTSVALQLISRLWVLGGVDDYLNTNRDFFFGAMLRFNDEDLKSVMPFAGGLARGGG